MLHSEAFIQYFCAIDVGHSIGHGVQSLSSSREEDHCKDAGRHGEAFALRIEAAIAPARWAEYKERHRASEVDEEA